jgi:arabinogalactan endo-1,4-beta-galactosidase
MLKGKEEMDRGAWSGFAYGADVGWLAQLETNGFIWKNDDGVTQDPLKILQDHGVDSIRLRVFVNPPENGVWHKTDTETCYLGYADTAGVIAMAKRADHLGMRIMVDFHYSDHFADPAYQDVPAAWSGHDYSQLCTDVYDFTYHVMTQLVEAGITPEWAQVGNEINNGILLPYGSSDTNFSQLAGLLNSGYHAVKAVSSSTKVVTHLADGYDNGTFRRFFDNFLHTYNGLTDVIGMSYYPYWIGTPYTSSIGNLTDNLEDMASRYGKEVLIAEVGGNEDDPQVSYSMLMAVMNAVKGIPGNMGAGVFYWEPEANSAVLPDGYHLGASTKLSGNVLQFTKAIDAYTDNKIFSDEDAI